MLLLLIVMKIWAQRGRQSAHLMGVTTLLHTGAPFWDCMPICLRAIQKPIFQCWFIHSSGLHLLQATSSQLGCVGKPVWGACRIHGGNTYSPSTTTTSIQHHRRQLDLAEQQYAVGIILAITSAKQSATRAHQSHCCLILFMLP